MDRSDATIAENRIRDWIIRFFSDIRLSFDDKSQISIKVIRFSGSKVGSILSYLK